MRSRQSRIAVGFASERQFDGFARVSASPSPGSRKRAARLTRSRQPRCRPDCPTGPWRTARTGPAPPVPPCFIRSRSGIANSYNDNPAPAQGADAHIDIIRLWQLLVVRAASRDRPGNPNSSVPALRRGGQPEHAPAKSGTISGRSPAAARPRFSISSGRRRGPRIGRRRNAAATDLAVLSIEVHARSIGMTARPSSRGADCMSDACEAMSAMAYSGS